MRYYKDIGTPVVAYPGHRVKLHPHVGRRVSLYPSVNYPIYRREVRRGGGIKKIFAWVLPIIVTTAFLTQALTIESSNHKESAPVLVSKKGGSHAPDYTLTLKNGNIIHCKLEFVHPHTGTVYMKWQGGLIGFGKDEIQSMKPASAAVEGDGIFLRQAGAGHKWWPHRNNPVIRLVNDQVLDVEIKGVYPDRLIVRDELKSGGFVEYRLAKDEVKSVQFEYGRPVESKRALESLRRRFPLFASYKHEMWYPKPKRLRRNFSLAKKTHSNRAVKMADVENPLQSYYEFFRLVQSL